MRNHSYRFFIKYLLSYVILLLLPITVITLMVYSFFVNQLQEEVISGNLNTLDKVRAAMDEQLQRVEDTTRQLLVEDNSLYPYRISDQWGYKTWGITRELARYQRMSPFIHEIWVYFAKEPTVFTSKGVYSIPMLANQIYRFEDWPEADLAQDLHESKNSVLLTPGYDAKSGERFVRWIKPMYPNQKQPYGTIVYLINEKSIQQLMSTYETTKGSVWIYDQNDHLVASVADGEHPSSDSASYLITSGADRPYQQISINHTKYYRFLVESKLTGWKYATLLPVDVVMSKVDLARKWLTYGIFVILLGGGGIIYAGMRSNYIPLHRLRKESHRLLPNPGEAMNELETVRYTLAQLADRNRDLDHRVRHQAGAIRKQMVLNVLQGEIASVAEMADHDTALADIEPGAWSQVVIAELGRVPDGNGLPSIQEMEQCYAHGGTKAIMGIEHFEPGRYVFLLLLPEKEREEADRCLQRYHETLRLLAGGTVTFGVGTPVPVCNSPRSYLEAQTALDYRFIQGVNRIIHYRDIPLNFDDKDIYPHALMNDLLHALRQGKAGEIQAALSALTEFIRQGQMPLMFARSLCYDIIRAVNGAWNDTAHDDQHSARTPDVFVLERLETMDAFEDWISSVSQDISAALALQESVNSGPAPDASSSGEPAARSVEAMTRYIREHYDQCDFSLQSMSEAFGVALPNLSQSFKEKTGQTLLEHVTSLRMEKAQKLLTTTMKPLSSVAEEVGYYNVSSFIRRFKQLHGLTPGEFRNRAAATAVPPSTSTSAKT